MADMLASFQKFKTYNRKQGKIRTSNGRKRSQSLDIPALWRIYSASFLSQVLDLPQGIEKDEAA